MMDNRKVHVLLNILNDPLSMEIVTKIEDAQNLWRKLQEDVNKDTFDVSKEEEEENSQGNVLARRATYEDLASQGLL